jgi:hypothetical protein
LLDVFKTVRVADRSQHDRKYIGFQPRNRLQVIIILTAAASFVNFFLDLLNLIFGIFDNVRKSFVLKLHRCAREVAH